MLHGGLGDGGARTGDHVDHPWRQSRRLEDLHDHLRGEERGGCRFPHHGVAHDRRRDCEVASDRREVEGADREHESLERAVIHAIPGSGGGHGLRLAELLAEMHVPAPEVDQFAGRVDLRLVDALALAEDRGGVEAVTEGTARGGRRRAGTQRPVSPRVRSTSRCARQGRHRRRRERRRWSRSRPRTMPSEWRWGARDRDRARHRPSTGPPADVQRHLVRRCACMSLQGGAEAGSLRRTRGHTAGRARCAVAVNSSRAIVAQ